MTYRARLCKLSSRTLAAAFAMALASSISCGQSLTVTCESGTVYDEQIVPVVCRHCGSQKCNCELTCCPQRVTETEKKPFWKVTCEYVCIPGFRFPWECKKDACGRECLVCGRVRAVNILEQEEYECETCGYKWEVKCVRRIGEPRDSGCQCPRCAQGESARVASEGRPARK